MKPEPARYPKECICQQCGKNFTHPMRTTKFCSMKCSRRAYYDKNYTKSPYESSGIGRITVGAANELRVAADLMFKGYEVFRALSPQASCDLAILKNGKLLRVEVRSGRPSRNRKSPFWPKDKRPGLSDVWVVVLPDQIIYNPPL